MSTLRTILLILAWIAGVLAACWAIGREATP